MFICCCALAAFCIIMANACAEAWYRLASAAAGACPSTETLVCDIVSVITPLTGVGIATSGFLLAVRVAFKVVVLPRDESGQRAGEDLVHGLAGYGGGDRVVRLLLRDGIFGRDRHGAPNARGVGSVLQRQTGGDRHQVERRIDGGL